ncbi:hypothetical protein EVAR_70420_1 [Eumeta japonica]|uniref:Uncharacterized protein n=1 Tax=Eumeta variegata TaxID=151549 RepID=A0A4C2A2P7_EUMVA|nr:hypothetical protein EVAR_70420_1 [Eumeta japonica]
MPSQDTFLFKIEGLELSIDHNGIVQFGVNRFDRSTFGRFDDHRNRFSDNVLDRRLNTVPETWRHIQVLEPLSSRGIGFTHKTIFSIYTHGQSQPQRVTIALLPIVIACLMGEWDHGESEELGLQTFRTASVQSTSTNTVVSSACKGPDLGVLSEKRRKSLLFDLNQLISFTPCHSRNAEPERR